MQYLTKIIIHYFSACIVCHNKQLPPLCPHVTCQPTEIQAWLNLFRETTCFFSAENRFTYLLHCRYQNGKTCTVLVWSLYGAYRVMFFTYICRNIWKKKLQALYKFCTSSRQKTCIQVVGKSNLYLSCRGLPRNSLVLY